MAIGHVMLPGSERVAVPGAQATGRANANATIAALRPSASWSSEAATSRTTLRDPTRTPGNGGTSRVTVHRPQCTTRLVNGGT
jgi:hypothetical protein